MSLLPILPLHSQGWWHHASTPKPSVAPSGLQTTVQYSRATMVCPYPLPSHLWMNLWDPPEVCFCSWILCRNWSEIHEPAPVQVLTLEGSGRLHAGKNKCDLILWTYRPAGLLTPRSLGPPYATTQPITPSPSWNAPSTERGSLTNPAKKNPFLSPTPIALQSLV